MKVFKWLFAHLPLGICLLLAFKAGEFYGAEHPCDVIEWLTIVFPLCVAIGWGVGYRIRING